jgi:hypothetical protein
LDWMDGVVFSSCCVGRQKRQTYSSIPGAETRDAAGGGLPLVVRDDGFEGVADYVPELVVLVLEQQD